MMNLMTGVHMVMCVFLTAALIGIMVSPHYGKDQFICALTIYAYQLLILNALLTKNEK